MLLCPHCNKQYDDGFTICALCGRELIDYTPLVTEQELEAVADTMLGDEDDLPGAFVAEKADLDENEPQLLVTVDDRLEAGRIMALLEDLHIPCLKKSIGAGHAIEIMAGESAFGYDIYVPGSMMRQALDAIAIVPMSDMESDDDMELLDDLEEIETSKALSDESDSMERVFEEPIDPVEDEQALERSARRIWMALLISGAVIALGGIAIALITYFAQ